MMIRRWLYTIVIAAAGLSFVAAYDPFAIWRHDFAEFGAKCDGSTNDFAALTTAMASGKKLGGAFKTCAYAGNLTLPDAANIADVRFKQLAPHGTSTVRTLTKTSGSGPVTLENVTIDRNGATSDCNVANCAGLYIDNIDDVTLRHFEVTGNSKGNGLTIAHGRHIVLENPYVHDMQWSNATDPGIEQITAIAVGASNTDVRITNPHVAHITGVIGSNPARAYQTDGIGAGGNNTVTIIGGLIEDVGECIDTNSSVVGTSFWAYGVVCKDIDSHAFKIGGVNDSGVIGGICIDAGLDCVTTGANSVSVVGPSHLRFAHMQALNTGSNGKWAQPRGFSLEYDGTPGVEPVDIRCDDCSAIDTGGTMKWAFFSDPTMRWGLTNAYGAGYTTTFGHTEGIDVNYINTILPFGGVIGTALNAGGSAIAGGVRNPAGTAGTETCFDLNPNTQAEGVRSAKICAKHDGAGNQASLILKVSDGSNPAATVATFDGTSFGLFLSASTKLRTGKNTVGNLGTCDAAHDGDRFQVTDANATTFWSAVASGGANHVPVICDGGTSVWRIGG